MSLWAVVGEALYDDRLPPADVLVPELASIEILDRLSSDFIALLRNIPYEEDREEDCG